MLTIIIFYNNNKLHLKVYNLIFIKMSDKLVFDLSNEVEGSPMVFIRKDWINILDNNSQNYNNSQSKIDTSQLSNSNKFMAYQEAYLSVPILLTLAMPKNGAEIEYASVSSNLQANSGATYNVAQFTDQGSPDHILGLKNWFGSIIHSMTLDYNGVTITQQTSFMNMWNSFKLMTSMSLNDIVTQGAKIGFYPDDATTFQFYPADTGSAIGLTSSLAQGDYIMSGTCNNSNFEDLQIFEDVFNSYRSGLGNHGFIKRQGLINFDTDSIVSNFSSNDVRAGGTNATYASLIAASSVNALWKSHVLTKQSAILTSPGGTGAAITVAQSPVFQIDVTACIMLKHVHSFFNMVPLLKGVFMTLTLNLNNASSTIVSTFNSAGAGILEFSGMALDSVTNAIGGVNPLMIASPSVSNGSTIPLAANAGVDGTGGGAIAVSSSGACLRLKYVSNISIGSKCLDSSISGLPGVAEGSLSKSVYLYIPAYTFNPKFEEAYVSSAIKQIKYTDIYQYQVSNVAGTSGVVNALITNGIANIKSVLVLPFYSPNGGTEITNVKKAVTQNSNTGIRTGVPVFQSPFDPAGCGPTSPLCHLTNFNIQVSGQNAIYNMEKYGFEQFNNQLYGQNSVNGGLTDGLTSGLIGREEFDMNYCYYYVDVERMLPIEQDVPKSIQLLGTNLSAKNVDYYVFVEYGVQINVDVLTGARV